MTFFMPESYAPRLLQVKANKLKKATGRQDLQPLLTLNIPKKELFIRSIVRPLKVSHASGKLAILANEQKLLTSSPIAFCICAYTSIIYGILCIEKSFRLELRLLQLTNI